MLSGINEIIFAPSVLSSHRTHISINKMVCQEIICEVLMTLVNGHAHDKSSMKKRDLLDNADCGLDKDVLEQKVEEIIEDFSFLSEWGSHRDTKIHIDQSTGKILEILVERCNEEPEWLFPDLGSHVPNATWEKYGVDPNRRR